jgi:hypothetical protein
MWTRDSTGSVVDQNGRVIWFSLERFVRDIALGNCCFVCGVSPNEALFNDEHVIPEWLLRRYNLFARTITLPNGETIRYDRYKVPCCATCNSLMGERLEAPISKVTAQGRQAVHRVLYTVSPLPFFVWLALIYLKTHLKDRAFRLHLDARKGQQRIADDYEWGRLHHLHCVVRSFLTDVEISSEVIGSFVLLRATRSSREEPFDFVDLYLAQTMYLRMGELAFVTAFNDSGCALRYFRAKLAKMNGPLNTLQLREVAAEIAAIVLHMKRLPEFQSLFDFEAKRHLISARTPVDDTLSKWHPQVKGGLLHHSLKEFGSTLSGAGITSKETFKLIRKGALTFLFDNDGKFISGAKTRSRTSSKVSRIKRRAKSKTLAKR